MGLTAHRMDGATTDELGRRHVATVAAAAELDVSSGPQLVSRVAELIARPDPTPITIDLSAVRFIDAAGIRALFECQAVTDRVGRSLRFENPTPAVRRLAALFDEVSRLVDVER